MSPPFMLLNGILLISAANAWVQAVNMKPTPLRPQTTVLSVVAEPDADLLARRQANKESKPFIMAELRPYAMKLHTREQAPKEGQAKAAPTPMKAWAPTSSGYLQFLVDSKHVYGKLEAIVGGREDLADLRGTGLERTKALAKDIVWLAASRGCLVPEVGEQGLAYASHLEDLSLQGEASTPQFLNHFYNFYFAHTAGGRMIGGRLSSVLLGGKTLGFYQWEGDVKELLGGCAATIDAKAKQWSREQKDACLQETESAFKFGGSLLGYLR